MNRSPILAARVLIADADRDLRRVLSIILRDEGIEVLDAEDGQTAARVLRQRSADIVMLDPMLPGFDGFRGLRELRQSHPDFPVILMTTAGTVEEAAEAGSWGVRGILTKPLRNDELILTLAMALGAHSTPSADQTPVAESTNPENDVMVSASIRKALAQAELVAATDFTVIIMGETGAGKEVMARAIHQRSHRSDGPFISVDCGAIPPSLIESELFGHIKGAFTGADRNRTGSFEAAAGGTLFLDEIGNLPMEMQAKLLRVLQERRIYRVGCCTPVELDVRILAATNENLEEMVDKGRFRRDLYYRLNEFNLAVPPLRERGDDILILARQFLDATSDELKKNVRNMTPLAEQMLLAHHWPGNVRELRNVIRRGVLLAKTELRPEHLGMIASNVKDRGPLVRNSFERDRADEAVGERDRADGEVGDLSFKEMVHHSVGRVEREILVRVLKQTEGNMKQAARVLHIDYKTLRTKAKQYGLHMACNLTSELK